ncbi:hypothetical protein Hypma_005263 [Hypsizygus marmoreus]|uniref:Uncharacterized protein n=1 Tax=Hypsizygus marmoreus TaxID=39966 RepID=A0A369JWI5_HYPMA|nr:hypothetical protein Hypma_005263 [Hypsizygus marmoreus]
MLPGILDEEDTSNDNNNQAAGEEQYINTADIDEIHTAHLFIDALRNASIDNGDLSANDVAMLLDPAEKPLEFDDLEDKYLLMCLRLFIAHTLSSQQTYTDSIDAIRLAHPEDTLLSYDQVKRRVANLTGIKPIKNDMCVNSCMAYTGPYVEKEACYRCGEPRFHPGTTNPRQQFFTIPLAPQVQALRRHHRSARDMQYFWNRVQELLREHAGAGIETLDDICCGTDVLQAVHDGHIGEHDTVLMMSFDGAQIYRNKTSDCWIYIWIIVNLSPDLRYKKKYVIPGGIIPGPNKPKIVESFLFPGFHHIASVNKLPGGGLPVWDANLDVKYISHFYVILATADGPGMVYLNGLVGHSGKIGCRLWCGLVGRHKPGKPTYYPALNKPENYNVAECDHPDVRVDIVLPINASRYSRHLLVLCQSRDQNDYDLRRRETGIVKPSIFSGLPRGSYLGIPNMFPGDIMHLILNIAGLLMGLWRGTIDCDPSDSRRNWAWVVLKGDKWEQHGQDVVNCTPQLPGSFDRPPRNPAEKINSGYKAWEFLLYLFGLGPGLFYGLLPDPFWHSYCKLVSGIRIIYQRQIRVRDQLRIAHLHLIQFTSEFEALYIERRTDRLHFSWQAVHHLSHIAPESLRVGPGICYSQWTMERSIGNLTEEIKQDSTPYANLSRRAVERAELNALKVMVPSLDKDLAKEKTIPRGGINIGNGYILLRAIDSCARDITRAEGDALMEFLEQDVACQAEDIPHGWKPRVVRWSRLRLPNGQVARSEWKESEKKTVNLRSARNVKIRHNQRLEFGEVQYYFRFDITSEVTRTLAMISLYSRPDLDLLRKSSNTLWSCRHQGVAGLVVVEARSIEAVVAMAPHSVTILGEEWAGRVFVVEKPGLDVAEMGGVVEDIPDEE